MTNAQEKALARVRRLVEEEMYSDQFEIKEWEVHENEYFVSLVGEWGMKGDEGTVAQFLCRDRFQLFIGKRGGITYPVTKTLKNGEFRCYQKRFEGYSILQAVVDQRCR